MVDGVPVMLRDDVLQTIPLAEASLRRARDPSFADPRAPELYLETLGIVDAEKQGIVELAALPPQAMDPVANFLVGATGGYMYEDLIGKLPAYPIPELRLPAGEAKRLLDVGCSWGRWSVAAARKGYETVGIDPSLGAVMAARRVARTLGVRSRYLVADARHLPFSDAVFDAVFSYSVLQHFSKVDAQTALREFARTMIPGGSSLIQMASAFGVRSLYHQIRRGFRPPEVFDVRYWRPAELQEVFDRLIGRSDLSADCYFGLGLQSSDAAMLPLPKRLLLRASRAAVRASHWFYPLVYLADSIYVRSTTCLE